MKKHMPQKRRSARNKGQSLVEVLVATAVVGVVMTAIAAGLLLSVKNTALSKYRALANYKAQEALEVFRRERGQLGWTSFVASLREGVICMNSLPTSGASGSGTLAAYMATNNNLCPSAVEEAGTQFTREADVEINGSSTEVRVEIEVTWIDGNTPRSVNLVQEFKEY